MICKNCGYEASDDDVYYPKYGKGLIVLSVIASVFVLTYTVIAAVISDSILAMFATEFSSGKITIGAPIVSTAPSILILVISFIFALTRDEKRENEEEF